MTSRAQPTAGEPTARTINLMSDDREDLTTEPVAPRDELLAKLDESTAWRPEPGSSLERVLAAVREFDEQLNEVLAQFPEDEQDVARRRVYIDADGKPRTRHGQLHLA